MKNVVETWTFSMSVCLLLICDLPIYTVFGNSWDNGPFGLSLWVYVLAAEFLLLCYDGSRRPNQQADLFQDNVVCADHSLAVCNVQCRTWPRRKRWLSWCFKTPLALEASYKQDHPMSDATVRGPYILNPGFLIVAKTCRCCCHSTTRRSWVWNKPLEFRRQGSSNFVTASSLLRLHPAVVMAMRKSAPRRHELANSGSSSSSSCE